MDHLQTVDHKINKKYAIYWVTYEKNGAVIYEIIFNGEGEYSVLSNK